MGDYREPLVGAKGQGIWNDDLNQSALQRAAYFVRGSFKANYRSSRATAASF